MSHGADGNDDEWSEASNARGLSLVRLSLWVLKWHWFLFLVRLCASVAGNVIGTLIVVEMSRAYDTLDPQVVWDIGELLAIAFVLGFVSSYLSAVLRTEAQLQLAIWGTFVFLRQLVPWPLPQETWGMVENQFADVANIPHGMLTSVVTLATNLTLGLWFASSLQIPTELLIAKLAPDLALAILGAFEARKRRSFSVVTAHKYNVFKNALAHVLALKPWAQGQRCIPMLEKHTVNVTADMWDVQLRHSHWMALAFPIARSLISSSGKLVSIFLGLSAVRRGDLTIGRLVIVGQLMSKVSGAITGSVSLYTAHGTLAGRLRDVLVQLRCAPSKLDQVSGNGQFPGTLARAMREQHGMTVLGGLLCSREARRVRLVKRLREARDKQVRERQMLERKRLTEHLQKQEDRKILGLEPLPSLPRPLQPLAPQDPRLSSASQPDYDVASRNCVVSSNDQFRELSLARPRIAGNVRVWGKALLKPDVDWEFALADGSLTLLTGANGVGKSTLLRTLVGERLQPVLPKQWVERQKLKPKDPKWCHKHKLPDEELGSLKDEPTLFATLGGLDLLSDYSSMFPSGVSDHVAWVPQTNQLMPGTLRDNVWPRYDEEQRSTRQLTAFIERYKFPWRWDRTWDKGWLTPVTAAKRVSGGECQRVALLRAAMRQDASFLVMDEPLASLDLATVRWLLAWLEAGKAKRQGLSSPSSSSPRARRRASVFTDQEGQDHELDIDPARDTGGLACMQTVLICTHRLAAFARLKPDVLVIKEDHTLERMSFDDALAWSQQGSHEASDGGEEKKDARA